MNFACVFYRGSVQCATMSTLFLEAQKHIVEKYSIYEHTNGLPFPYGVLCDMFSWAVKLKGAKSHVSLCRSRYLISERLVRTISREPVRFNERINLTFRSAPPTMSRTASLQPSVVAREVECGCINLSRISLFSRRRGEADSKAYPKNHHTHATTRETTWKTPSAQSAGQLLASSKRHSLRSSCGEWQK